jgi:DNA-binding NtrC family response regulator
MEQEFPDILPSNGSVPVNGNDHWLMQGVSPAIQNVGRIIRELAHSSVPVLLIGEPGCGKRIAAHHIHALSARGAEEFQIMTAAGLTADATEAFVSATVFLDEISQLSSASQRALLDRLSSPLSVNGGSPEAKVRIICGTACDLEAEVRAGRFREDVYYRISAVSLRIPPLRQRKEDIPQLVDRYLAKHAAEFRRPVPHLRAETRQFFQEYGWPGNLPELADVTKAIVALGDDALAMGGLRSLLARAEKSNGKEKVSLKEAAKAASREAEKELILRVLTRTRWNRRRAAEELQISYKALLYKLKQIGYGEMGAS